MFTLIGGTTSSNFSAEKLERQFTPPRGDVNFSYMYIGTHRSVAHYFVSCTFYTLRTSHIHYEHVRHFVINLNSRECHTLESGKKSRSIDHRICTRLQVLFARFHFSPAHRVPTRTHSASQPTLAKHRQTSAKLDTRTSSLDDTHAHP